MFYPKNSIAGWHNAEYYINLEKISMKIYMETSVKQSGRNP